MSDTDRYSDIINLPHRQSDKRPHMSNYDRAAQFSPFAALKGYDEEIGEVARYTEERPVLDESRVGALNDNLALLQEKITHKPMIAVTYFRDDELKDGGSYFTVKGVLKKIDGYARKLIFEDGSVIRFYELIEIEIL